MGEDWWGEIGLKSKRSRKWGKATFLSLASLLQCVIQFRSFNYNLYAVDSQTCIFGPNLSSRFHTYYISNFLTFLAETQAYHI